MPLYFISTLLYFWVPVLLMARWTWPRLDSLDKKAFWRTLAIFYGLALVMEYVYLYYDVWTFSEDFDPLLGLRVFNAPIEEFCFWFGATPFVLLLYLGLERRMRPAVVPPAPKRSGTFVLLQ